jgi:filamentous hemagglutinin
VLIGLNGSDVIDYEGTITSATPGSFSGGDTVVTLYDNTTVVATLTLQGDYSGDSFYAVAISSGVTQIGEMGGGDTATAPAGTGTDSYVWATVAGSWDNAANWDDTTPPGQSPAAVAPGSNDSVTINAVAGGNFNVITGVGNSASLTINGSTDLAGQFSTATLTVNGGTLSVNTGDALTVTGNASFTNGTSLLLDGTLTVDGNLSANYNNNFTINNTLTVDGNLSLTSDYDHFTINGVALIVDGSISASGYNDQFILNGGSLTAGSLTTTGYNEQFNLNGGALTVGSVTVSGLGYDIFNLSSGATLSITGDFTDTSTYGSYFYINDSTFTVGGTYTPSSVGDTIVVFNSGVLQLAALATDAKVNLVVNDSTSSLEIGTAGGVATGSLTIDQGVTVTASGSFTAPNMVVDGTLAVAAGGGVTLDGSLGGSGQIQIGSGGNLAVENDRGQPTAMSAPTITFEGSNDALTIYGNALNASNSFVPVLIGLNGSDVIDYEGTITSATPGSFSGGDTVVTLYDGTTVVATVTLQGDYSSNTFITTQIGGGVTQIVDPPPAVATASGGNSEISSTSVLSNNATGGTTVVDPPANTPPTSILNSLVAGDLPTHPSFGLNNALTTTGVQDHAPPNLPPGLEHVAALFNQFVAAGLPGQNGAPITTPLSQIVANEQQFLAQPHHG